MKDFGENIVKKETFTVDDYSKGIKEEVLKNKISTKYLDEFRQKIYNNSNVIPYNNYKRIAGYLKGFENN